MMQTSVVVLVGLALSAPAVAEPLVEGRVRLSAGQSAAAAQVLLFDLTDLQRGPVARATTDAEGYFALVPLGGPARPQGFALGQNYPNPFNPSTIIPYQLPTAAQVRLEVFNVLGQRVATLVDEERSAGFHAVAWDATNAAGQAVAAGVYMYRLTAGGERHTRRMVLIDGQAGVATGAAPAATLSAEAVDRKYGLAVVGAGLATYVDADFQVGMAPVDIVVETLASALRAKVQTGGLGDVNNDGQVDLADALAVALYIIDSSITPPNNDDISLGDVNADGQLTTADVLLIAAYSANPSDPLLPTGIGQAVGGETGALRRLTDDPAADWSPSFSPDGRHIAFVSERDGNREIYVMDSDGSNPRRLTDDPAADFSPSFSPDGRHIAFVSERDGNSEIYVMGSDGSNPIRLTHHPAYDFSPSFSPDGRHIVFGSERDGEIYAMELREEGGEISSIDGLAVADYVTWHLPEGSLARLGKGTIEAAAFSPDGQMLAVAGSIGIWLYDVATSRELALLTGHTSGVGSVSFSPDGSLLASGSGDGTVILWDIWSESQLATLQGHRWRVESVSFSPDGSVLVSGGSDVILWDVSSRSQLATLQGSSPVSFSLDGSMLASGGWGSDVILWDVSSRNQLAILQGHTAMVESVSFSADGSMLVSGGGENEVILWDVSSGSQLATLQGHTDRVWSVSFSPADSILAFGKVDGNVILWDVSSGSQLATLQGHTSAVESVSFSADGSMLVSGGWDNEVILWDVSSRSQLASLQGHTERVSSVSFSADGSTLVSGSSDGTVLLWRLASIASRQ